MSYPTLSDDEREAILVAKETLLKESEAAKKQNKASK